MENRVVSKIVGLDQDSGLNIRVDINKMIIDLKNNFIEVYYDKVLATKAGKVITTTENERAYIRRNIPEQMGTRPKAGKPAEMEEYIVTEADNQFDRFADSEVGQAILEMLKSDLDKYPNLQ